MIRRKLLIATTIIASVVITACSDMTAPKKLVPGGLPAAAILAPPQVAAADREGNRKHVTVVATINGRGTSEMTAPGFVLGKTVFSMEVKLLSDGSAKGDIICIDVFGESTLPGVISGKVVSWSMEGTVVVLKVIGTVAGFLPPDGHPGPFRPAAVTVKIYKFGGAGVSLWTMEDTATRFLFCYETLTSGKIVIVYRKDDDRDHDVGDDSGR